ncbi:MAG TPA: hypothetical protein VLJ16_14535, partial [Acidobacteriota bacterium]|nr:hypothetical protein [Acidobacteriota bacterium]
LFLIVFILHAGIWGFRLGLMHAAFGLTVSILGVQAAFFHYRKIPFACPWVPGRLKLQFTAVPCLVGLLLAMMLLAAIEKAVLADPVRALAFAAVAAGTGFLLRQANNRSYGTAGLCFDDKPEAALIEFPPGD